MAELRHLVLVLGDQLDPQAAAFDGFDPARDAVWMAEVAEESTHVWSSQPRIAVFLAGMRHFAEALRAAGRPLHYRTLDDPANRGTLAAELSATMEASRPTRLVMTAPGDWRVLQALRGVAAAHGLPLELRPDRHFYATVQDFAAHARGRATVRMEYYYRALRQRHGVLMEADGGPAGGQWNFDHYNRGSFGARGPQGLPVPRRFAPDALTQEVLALVRRRLGDHPGSPDAFDWPVTPQDARAALDDFVQHRLPHFGRYQDAMWPGEPWLYHARISAALNLKLLDPRDAVAAAEAAWRAGRVPLAAAEGFVRQILGWREYVRGVYWTQMPGYLERNALGATADLPAWYWTGDTPMACLRDTLGQTLRLGYAHHIQRLMVTGLYAMLLGVDPRQVHAWYLSVYVDAVEWVELPNTLGMSQYADGGLMGSKPYAASGRYIQKMAAGYCKGCRFDPAQRTGDTACPFTVLYWDFLARHQPLLAGNRRMAYPLQALARIPAAERARISLQAARLRHPDTAAGTDAGT
ncbi:cryptochrome/photolyase family protein [Xylophilus sp. Leaf220]|uniref:cryptochrome/photolyase family protein n=1 Tax=Xylophilus sp. Leaf220 TaxID=1735686 RepID=UPI0006FB829D|nr:cryptochrome/photolyase family protein [Xylophilus sp. Leaf220]KQM80450.1 deoxyribodipyrimidine photolyase [Xylophilus sp. Leaf220]